MTTARTKAGGPLGLTSSKAGLKKAGGKRGLKIDQAVQAIANSHEPSAPPRTYTDAELKLAEGRAALDASDSKYDALWADACCTMGGEPSTYNELMQFMRRRRAALSISSGYLT